VGKKSFKNASVITDAVDFVEGAEKNDNVLLVTLYNFEISTQLAEHFKVHCFTFINYGIMLCLFYQRS